MSCSTLLVLNNGTGQKFGRKTCKKADNKFCVSKIFKNASFLPYGIENSKTRGQLV